MKNITPNRPIRMAIFLLFCAHFASAQLSNLSKLRIRNIGPANMSGRITSIDAAHANPHLIYVGAASGGIWKSENGGTAWTPVFDAQPTQNIGCVRIQQSNPQVVWAGTGEGNPRNSMNLGMGIFRSADGGNTWVHLGLEETKTIHRILIDPRDSNTVYVGSMGDPFTPGPHRGLYKTTDGGATWKRILYSNAYSGIADLVMDPNNPQKLFAALYEHHRTPYSFTSGGSGSGLFVTYNGGATWKQLGAADGLPAGDLGRMGIAIAPSDTNRIYAKIEATKNALYRSDDAGKSWQKINDNPKFTNNRPFYFQDLAVDPVDPNRLYNIYQPLTLSYDGGVTFDAVPMIPADETKGIHADFHAFWVNPSDPLHFIIGGDGGLGITHDHGKSWFFPENIPVAQFYHVQADEDLPFNVYGGMQDNGNWSGPAYTWKRGGIRTLYWQYLVGGDGFDIAPDLDNSRFGYGSSQNGYLYRYDKLTGYYCSIRPPAPNRNTFLRFNWNAGFAKNPWNTHSVYYGSQFVHVTYDKGATWHILSPDLTTNNPEHQRADYGGLTLDVSGAEIYNSILTIAPSTLDSQLIWVGTDDGQVQLTTNGGTSWTNLTGNITGLPKEAWITQLHASRYHSGTVWLVANNYRKGDYAPYLFLSEDYGKNWTRLVDDTKVKGYALSVIQDPKEPRLVFLGTEQGLWLSMDSGKTWSQFQNGFPCVPTMDMVIQEKESALVVGTFGRAIWIIDDLSSLREIVAGRLNPGLTALPINDAVQVKGLFIAPPGNIWTGFHTTFEGENRVFQKVEVPFFIGALPGKTDSVRARVYNEKNERIQELSASGLEKGLNYLIWKLDEAIAPIPPAWASEEERGIPVLPGTYTIVLEYRHFKDTTEVTVIPDPRFAIPPRVDIELHDFRKSVYTEAAHLFRLLKTVDQCLSTTDNIEKYIRSQSDAKAKKLLPEVLEMKETMHALRQKGQPRPKNRQLGAWQSKEVSPYSQLEELILVAAARTAPPSVQEWQRLEEVVTLVQGLDAAVQSVLSNQWKRFREKYQIMNKEWFQ